MNRCPLFLVPIALALGGCPAPPNNGADMALGDLSAVVDLVRPADTAKPTGKPTGEPCTANADCLPSVAGTSTVPLCLKMDASGTVYTNGYCSSPCRPLKTDVTNGVNSDCPGTDLATCVPTSSTAGQCRKICSDATVECRSTEGYVCLNNAPFAATCAPKDMEWCDPKMAMSCPKAPDGNDQLCISYSPDNSAGSCAELCDVFVQNCPPPTSGTVGCLASTSTGVSTCIQSVNPVNEGDACVYLNNCIPPLVCSGKVCRRYCRVGSGVDGSAPTDDGGTSGDGGALPFSGDYPCMMGTCTDLSTTVKKDKLGVCK